MDVGTLELSGNAQVNHVTAGNTFYTTDTKQKLTGTMSINDITSFTVGLSSGRIVTAKWTNPVQALGKPFGGVYIRYQTGSYPTPTTGTQIYKGLGSSSESGAQSQVSLTLPNLSTTYYFICYSYCVTSNGELIGTQLKTTVNTGSSQIIGINNTQNYTIPAGYNIADLFCVGGGGGNYSSSRYYGGGGAGGGYTTTVLNVAVSAGQVLNCTVGGGGVGSNNGGTSTIIRNGTTLCSANGGYKSSAGSTGSGGSGGGMYAYNSGMSGSQGGSNGGNGGGSGGTGQGRTTRAFGESNLSLYSGGGGGGGYYANGSQGGSGGAGGGGAGGNRANRPGRPGGANTGGGAGGGFQSNTSNPSENPDNSANGGSGIILIRLK